MADVFYQCRWKLERETNFVALTTPDFSFLEGVIKSTNGAVIKEEDYWDHLHNVVLPYSQAQGFRFEGQPFMVGALARLNLNKERLHPKTRQSLSKYLDVFPSQNIYHNNLAQAIEILHCLDHSLDLLEYDFKKELPVKPEHLSGEGVGVIEAPRGTLYYWLGIRDGKVRYLNLVIPTAQNLVNMRQDVKELVTKLCECSDGACEETIRKEVEKIIRAYDPCMSCASHFLKVNWL